MGKIKILHVTSTATGGSAFSILMLARHIDRNVFEISVAVPPDGPFYCDMVKTGARVYPLTISRHPLRYCNIKGFFQIRKILRDEKFDIVHTHTSVGGFLGRIAAKLERISIVIWSTHGWAYNYPRGTWLNRRIFLALEKFLDYFTDHYLAVCEKMKNVGIKMNIGIEGKYTVIHYGIETWKYHINERNTIRMELGLSNGSVVVGMAGRFEQQKGIDLFLQAAQVVKRRFPHVKFLVVGDGPLKKEMEEQTLTLGLTKDIIFTGWKTNVADYIGVMDIFCIPSRWEALPLVLLEAMALGKPVVATNVGGIQEALEDGKTGILIPPFNSGALANAIMSLVSNRETAQMMGKAGTQRVQQVFSIKQMIINYERLCIYLFEKKHKT